jgi:hypothetical protein
VQQVIVVPDGMRTWLAAERRITLWLAVFTGAGIIGYFALRDEPPIWLGATGRCPRWSACCCCGAFMALAAAGIGFVTARLATARAPPIESPAMQREGDAGGEDWGPQFSPSLYGRG